MAKVYSFPGGELIEDTGNPVQKKDELLGYVKNNPEDAALKFREMSIQIQLLADCLNQINVYCQTNKNEQSSSIVSIINKCLS